MLIMVNKWDIPSGKRLHKLWNITMFLIGRSTMNMGQFFDSYVNVYQRVWMIFPALQLHL